MKKMEIINRSIYIITEYYKGNLQPYFDAFATNILWIGPRSHQILEGKDNLISAWEEVPNLTFTIGNIEGKAVSTGTNNMEVLLGYYVYTHFPDGSVDEHHQRLHFSWGIEKENGKKIPKVFMIHITNMIDGEEKNESGKVKIYASSQADSKVDAVRSANSLPRIHFRKIYGRGENEVTYYFNTVTIMWVESTDEGRHSLVHTVDDTYKSMEHLTYFEKEVEGMLIRAHASYLVNPIYVQSITRFSVTLTDDILIPIPEKKYTQFKKKLETWHMPE